MRRTNCSLSLFILLLASLNVFSQSSNEKTTKEKRIFTNEDLGRIREKYGSGADSEPAERRDQPTDSTKQAGQTATSGKVPTPESKGYWVAKLKETESVLTKAKEQESKFQGLVEKYEQKVRDAKGDFHTKTSQEQAADSLKNLARAKDQIKQGEEAKTKLLAEAAEKGFKPSDLRDEASR